MESRKEFRNAERGAAKEDRIRRDGGGGTGEEDKTGVDQGVWGISTPEKEESDVGVARFEAKDRAVSEEIGGKLGKGKERRLLQERWWELRLEKDLKKRTLERSSGKPKLETERGARRISAPREKRGAKVVKEVGGLAGNESVKENPERSLRETATCKRGGDVQGLRDAIKAGEEVEREDVLRVERGLGERKLGGGKLEKDLRREILEKVEEKLGQGKELGEGHLGEDLWERELEKGNGK